jgi:rubrerythrin
MIRINFTEREFENLLWLVFTDDKISINENAEEDNYRRMSIKFKRWADKFCFDDVIEDIKFNQGVKMVDEDEQMELEEKRDRISKEDGIFYCQKCKLRTDEKTYETKCIICNTGLNRVGTS